MQVFVDGAVYEPAGGGEQTVGELAAEVGTAAAGERRIVVRLECDGRPVEDDEIGAVLARRAGDFQKLELHTQPLRPLVGNILAETLDLLGQADQARQRAADLLVESRTEEAMTHLQSFLTFWQQVQEAMVLCARALEVDLESLDLGGQALPEVFEAIRKLLSDLKEAMTRHDYVVVGDILQYEFVEPLRDWLALLKSLRQRAAM